ncbi:hypothetical protein LCGC14_2175950 [marine sediment metagenome]|uniref:Uncharacterized protein n=1 Tax=marine sediment metagenome TaxID=412755 RepID=A0A0F9DNN4_9ZZZZ
MADYVCPKCGHVQGDNIRSKVEEMFKEVNPDIKFVSGCSVCGAEMEEVNE